MKHLILTTLPRWRASIGALLAVLSLSTVPMPVHATEEPSYQVVREFSGIEVREYAAYTVAEVVVAGPAGEAGGQAFPVLAGYIFGKNKGERKFDMTAPVTQTAAPVEMEMTAPVTQSVQAGGFLVQFVLPKGVTLANAPEPLDSRVQLRDVSPHQVAVLRYSGFWSEANDNEQLLKLQSALKAANLVWTGDPVFSRYDPPFKPWFLRRNEVWLRLASP
ncbi:heme-binding protein [Hydrogenophaga sp.]|uniref:SOUL family heme-binding protein n=1 Tax=Hydrogenophaga sp. TaxID=1904254 RepID=UPI002731E7F1|nr:heme-binding protein [Hydrogenophaga sp.]MDP2076266.1 heme-binding protein [Hydrogenophaga sp.]MDP3109474.1 heme-binding protein [Hydrogenophaga sp.]